MPRPSRSRREELGHAVAAKPPIRRTVRQIAKEHSARRSRGTDHDDLLVGGDKYGDGTAISPFDEAEHPPALSETAIEATVAVEAGSRTIGAVSVGQLVIGNSLRYWLAGSEPFFLVDRVK
jgi:hypothetical protein